MFSTAKIKMSCLAILLIGLIDFPASEFNTNSEIGKKLYKLNCRFCHGKDGKRSFNGSKKIVLSKLSLDERITLITKGKGKMAGFQNNLTKAEIKAIAEYTLTFSNREE